MSLSTNNMYTISIMYIYIIYILYWHLFVFEKNQFRTIIRTPKLRSQHFRSSTSKGPQPPVERTALESPFAEKDGPGGGSFNLLDFEPKNGKSLSPLSEKWVRYLMVPAIVDGTLHPLAIWEDVARLKLFVMNSGQITPKPCSILLHLKQISVRLTHLRLQVCEDFLHQTLEGRLWPWTWLRQQNMALVWKGTRGNLPKIDGKIHFPKLRSWAILDFWTNTYGNRWVHLTRIRHPHATTYITYIAQAGF